MAKIITVILLFITIVGTIMFEQFIMADKKNQIVYLESELSTMKDNQDFLNKKEALKLAKKYLKTVESNNLIYMPLDEKLQYYYTIAKLYFPKSLYGKNRILFQFSGDLGPGTIKELYPDVYEAPMKILISFNNEIPYTLIAQSVSQFCNDQAVFLRELKLDPAKAEISFSILGPLEINKRMLGGLK